MSGVWFALGLTLVAGMATGIGSAIAFFAKRTNYRFLSVATGFSAGVMLYVSFVEIFVKGTDALVAAYGDHWGHWVNAASFFGGMLLIGLIDNLIPAAENPHETHTEEETAPLHDAEAPLPEVACHRSDDGAQRGRPARPPVDHHKLMRMGLFTALAIAIHNFPEGLATFLAALQDPSLGVAIAVAIALHNIPEGISVSVPIFYATGNRQEGVHLLVAQRSGRTGRRRIAYWLSWLFLGGDADGPAAGHGHALRRRGRHHGLHQPRRTAAHEPGLRQGPRQPLRPGRRDGW